MVYWFKAKKYGWGWYPSSWQGWAVLFIFIVITMLNAYNLGVMYAKNSIDVIYFLAETFALTLILIFVCYKKGEKPKWRWGK